MLEVEYKCLIDEETYNKIKHKYEWDSIKEQINYYYNDMSKELSKRRITVRIREKDGKLKLQAKRHKNSDSPLHISEESEIDVSSIPSLIDEQTARKITGVDSMGKLIKSGSLTTLRHSFMWNSTTEICLDKSTYLGITDYEVEIEYTLDAPLALIDEFKNMGVEFTENTAGKYSRFRNRLEEIAAMLKS